MASGSGFAAVTCWLAFGLTGVAISGQASAPNHEPAADVVQAPPCRPEAGRTVRAFAGEIAGDHDYREDLGNGWTFVLERTPPGWHARVLDAKGLDLTQLTPPFRFEPNPREIFGWHFRNADNSADNDGSVNAPQRLRLFQISPSLIGTAGFKPSTDTLADPGAQQSEGRGSLMILDYGLADLAKGQQARMVYLKFSACLSWPVEARAPESPAKADEYLKRFLACQLRWPYVLTPYLTPAVQTGDFDGDGTADIAGAVVRQTDGKRGLAVCRGQTLHLIGFQTPLGRLTPAYFDRMDHWRVEPGTFSPASSSGERAPALRGDAIAIGMQEKSSVLIYWDGTRFQSYWMGD